MKKIFLSGIVMLLACMVYAQHTLHLSVKHKDDHHPLAAATIILNPGNRSAVADSSGNAIFDNLPEGVYSVTASHIGFDAAQATVVIPRTVISPLELLLDHDHGHEHEEEEVVIRSTRISRSIANTPTRIEVISGEELEEKGNMKPGDIRMLLNESTGIQTQQTSATSFNAGIRIQGLDGRYTQILRDGYPLYSGFAGSLSLLQIAPLDLKQVEVIKGSASTLYGGGAIAGLVNLVSKTPGENRELNFLANGTTGGGLDLSGFYSERYGKAGVTVFASRNSNKAFDPAGIGLTAIPKFERYTINPRLFLYGKKTTADIGITYITEDRTGGSMDYIQNGGTGFFEKNNTDRITAQFGIAHKTGKNATLQLKNSYSRFDRLIAARGYSFDGLQQSSFSELTWNRSGEKADWVVGSNVWTEALKENGQSESTLRNYNFNTYGVFIQNAWTVSDFFVVETGLRGDYNTDYGFEWLPRLSAMFKVSPKLTTRLGGGYGYKTPTIFTEETERRQFRNLLPVNINHSANERSTGGNWDINYKTDIGEVGLSFNHLFFYTKLNQPLILSDAGDGNVELTNSAGYLDTKGMETNLRLTYADFKLFLGYTYTDANTHFNDKEWLPLTARHRLNNVLMYEIEEKLKLGLEAYYYSPQKLSDGVRGKSYWVTGFMAEKLWEKFSVFINFENFTNTRQTRFDTIFTGTVDNPVFRDIYAPVDGFVVNGGIKIRL
ncbi:TonB-dependent receptor [Niabella yanshanensis]|uniref:TonB-dependent receptor n=1 Tax=Niabella yanshanensis TaxID=577386 RepID=A0ABZ0W566_9BACT|nr:TonB-dependent receptor [Niabella yanshanensis]WQD37849.1 TonB-dependent receptor [Niabella yanshanensis]